MTDEQMAKVFALKNLDAFVFALLDDNRILSSRQLSEIANEVGRWGHVSHATAKRIREAWKAARAGVQPEDVPAPDNNRETIIARAEELLDKALTIGDSKSLEQLARALKVLKDVVAAPNAAVATTEDFRRLTQTERECMLALTDKLNGRPLDDEAMWWVAFLGNVPPYPRQRHPAHAELPAFERPPLLEVPADATVKA